MTTIDISSLDELTRLLEARRCTVKGNSTTCPWHDDATPSASIVKDDKGHARIYCHVCKRGADAIDLIAESEHMSATDWLIREREKARQSVEQQTKATESKPRQTWATRDELIESMVRSSGGIVDEVYEYEAVGGNPALHVIRIKQPPKVQGGKPGKTFRQCHCDGKVWRAEAPPKPWAIWRRSEVVAARSVVVVEGEKAAEALRALSITATTNPTGAGKAEHADFSPLSSKRVVVWPDHDIAGAEHGKQVVEMLSHLPAPPAALKVVNVARLNLPAKGDAFDFIEAIHGDTDAKRDAVLAVLRTAEDTGPARELVDLLNREISGEHALVVWPWPMLTRASRSLVPGAVTIIAGAPGASKSWLLLQCLLAWIASGIRVAALELEEVRAWHLKRALAMLEGTTDLLASEWCAAHKEETLTAYLRHHEPLAALGRALWCDGNLTMDRVAQWIEERCADGCRVIAVDPVTLVDPGASDPWKADRALMARAKVAIERVGASLVLITHPRKAYGPPGKAVAPSMDDMAGGAAFQRAAASVLWLMNLPAAKRETVEDEHGQQMAATLHRVVRVLKARNSTGVGAGVGFSVDRLRFVEQGCVMDRERTPPHRGVDHQQRAAGDG